MNETIGKGIRALGVALVILVIVVVAFVAGFASGNRLLSAPAAEGPAEIVTEPPRPTATMAPSPTPVPATETAPPPTATPAELPAGTSLPGADTSFELFWEVWSLIEQDYYGELPNDEERLYGAIRGALQTLDDDYTAFIEPEAAHISRDDASGSFEGIGALVGMNEANQLEIVRPLEDQPAEKAGLKPDDVVLAVDGKSIEGLGIYEAISLIRGPQGTIVVLTIQRAGEREPFPVEIVRARIPTPTIEAKMLEENIGYIRLYEFNSQATTRLREALTDLLAQQPVGIILDLRNNPGGFLNEAVSVADEFLPAGVILYERGTDRDQVFRSTDQGLGDEIALVVLINSGSASASEIVAGAIQDRGRGILIGETSFGKGSVQLPYTLSNGAELRVTIPRWYTPDEQPIHGKGLEPDIPVPYTEEDAEQDLDPQLERAILYLLTGE